MMVAYLMRFHLMEYHAQFSRQFYDHLVLVAAPMWLAIFAINSLYRTDYLFRGTREYVNVVNACTAGLVGLILYSFLNRGIKADISRGWLAMVWFFSVASVSLTRFSYRRLIHYLRRQGLFVRRALIVGTNEEGRAVAAQLRASSVAGVEVMGFVEPTHCQETTIEGVPVVSGLDKLNSLILTLGVDDLVVIPTALQREDLLDLYRDWGTDNRVRICLSSGLYELFTTGAQVRNVGSIPLVSLDRTRITGIDALMKTVLDYAGAMVGSALIILALPIVAPIIWLDSPGPIFHRRRVVGLYGHRFDAYKLRTMIQNADTFLRDNPELEKEWEETGKIKDDPRVTRVGRFLRRYSLDELPQLFNVLRGEMSLVGPRMITPQELRHFGRWRHNLLTVKPGLTGLWQVNGRSDVSYEGRVRMDMHYIRNYTIWMDVKLLFDTAKAVLLGQGAY
jgi:exopolysaccharide biosynthesis polyprenyl glycosylphosphotransferase